MDQRTVLVLRGGARAGCSTMVHRFSQEYGFEGVPTSKLWYRPLGLLCVSEFNLEGKGLVADEAPDLGRVSSLADIALGQLCRITNVDGVPCIDGVDVTGMLRDDRLTANSDPGKPGVLQYLAGTREAREWANEQMVAYVSGRPEANFAIEGRDEGGPLSDAGVEGLVRVYLDRSASAAALRSKGDFPERDEGDLFEFVVVQRDIPDVVRKAGRMLPDGNAVIADGRGARQLATARAAVGAGREVIYDTTKCSQRQVFGFLSRLVIPSAIDRVSLRLDTWSQQNA